MGGKMMGPGGKTILNILVWNLGQDCIQNPDHDLGQYYSF